MVLYVSVLFCLLSLTCFGHSSNKHMICREAGNVFGDVTNNEVHTRCLIGPKGEQGNMGEGGFTGFYGLPGAIDYDRVQEIVRLKVEEETRLLRLKVDKIETQLKNLTSSISETRALRATESPTVPQTTTQPTTGMRCNKGVIHEGICYWAEVHLYVTINYSEAQEFCSTKESRLADIYGKVHYDLIMDYLRGKLNGLYFTYVWTGMKKIYGNSIAQLSNGSPAPYTRQSSNGEYWDKADKRRTQVYLAVGSSANESDQGMEAGKPTHNFLGALCQTE